MVSEIIRPLSNGAIWQTAQRSHASFDEMRVSNTARISSYIVYL